MKLNQIKEWGKIILSIMIILCFAFGFYFMVIRFIKWAWMLGG